MSKLIATIITVVVVLGLIGGTILKMKADTENLGSKTEMEQNRINKLVDNPGAVNGEIVKEYNNTYSGKVSVYLSGSTIAEASMTNVKDKALFSMDTIYNADGDIGTVAFTQINLND